MATVRVRADLAAISVQDPNVPGARIALRANDPYEHDDPVVKAYSWAFESDIEQATAEPGVKRQVRAK
jgi:hypothetical protein